MVDHGWLWLTMDDQGRPWLTMEDNVDHGWLWLTMYDHVEYSWRWLTMFDNSWLWLTTVYYGWIAPQCDIGEGLCSTPMLRYVCHIEMSIRLITMLGFVQHIVT